MKGALWLLTFFTIRAAAADLGAESVTWGPVATTDADVQEGQWFGQAFGTATAGHPLDGLFAIDRPAAIDAQAAYGYTYDRHGTGIRQDRVIDDQYSDWGRVYARGGTDPLADHAGRFFAAVGGVLSLPMWMSVHGEVGYSAERKLLISGELDIVILRLRVDHDERIDTLRIGSGPRLLGTAGPLAWGALFDWAVSHGDIDGVSVSDNGPIGTGFVIWRPLNRLLLGFEAQIADHVVDLRDPAAAKSRVVQLSVEVGAVF